MDPEKLESELHEARAASEAGRQRLELRQFDEAKALLVRAIELNRRNLHGDHPDILDNQGLLADTCFALGHFDDSVDIYKKLLSKDFFCEQPTRKAELLFKLGKAQFKQKDFPQAVRSFEKAVKHCQVQLPKGHPLTALHFEALAHAKAKVKNLPGECAALRDKAREIRSKYSSINYKAKVLEPFLEQGTAFGITNGDNSEPAPNHAQVQTHESSNLLAVCLLALSLLTIMIWWLQHVR